MVDYTRKISLGAGTGVILTVLSIAGSIITVPLFLRAVGNDLYGLFAVVSTVAGFIGWTNFGLTAAVTNQISYLTAANDRAEISRLVSGTMIFLGGILFLVLALLLAGFKLDLLSAKFIFGVDESLDALASSLFLILLIFSAVNILGGGIFNSLFYGVNQIAHYNVIQSIYTVLYSLFFAGFLYFFKPDLIQIAFFQGGFILIRLFLFYGAARWFCGWLEFSFDPRLIKKIFPLLKHSFTFFVLMVLNSLIGKADMLVLAHTVGVAAAPVYNISDRILRLPSSAIQVSSFSGPTVAVLYQQKDYDGLRALYAKVVRMHFILKCAPLLFLTIYSKEVITLWVGAEYFYGYILVGLFLISYLVYAWNGPHFDFINSMFKQKAEVAPMAINIVVSVLISVYLSRFFGLSGIVAGTIAGNILTNSVYLPMFLARQINIQPFRILGRIVWSFTIPIVALFGLHYINLSLIIYWPARLTFAAAALSLYCLVVYYFVFQDGEKNFFAEKFLALQRRLKINF